MRITASAHGVSPRHGQEMSSLAGVLAVHQRLMLLALCPEADARMAKLYTGEAGLKPKINSAS